LGNFGSALAWSLHRAGVCVPEIVLRRGPDASQKTLARKIGARIVRWSAARLDSEVVWLCVPDDALPAAAKKLARELAANGRRKTIVLHSSGSLVADVANPRGAAGIKTASVHPFMSFPSREPRLLHGTWFGVEGDPAASRAAKNLVRRMGGRKLAIRTKNKAAYHAFGAMGSPMLIALLAAAEEIGEQAGLPQRDAKQLLASIAQQTLDNWKRNGLAKSFSGPIARGDAKTIALHSAALKGDAARIYGALAKFAVENLPAKRRAALRASLRSRRNA
jgi:predicted short-subunit dehydrogenase-like oxidoreductase (DUF2520 family)